MAFLNMNQQKQKSTHVIISGDGSLVNSIAACLLKSAYPVTLQTSNEKEAASAIHTHFDEMGKQNGNLSAVLSNLFFNADTNDSCKYELAIAITPEDISAKQNSIKKLENILSPETIIAVNTEAIALDEIQKDARCPERIIGLNWAEPAHTTNFLEIITNQKVKFELIDLLKNFAKTWNKDPYVVENFGVRSKLMSAMVREAFYLVENGYATVDDIDRACRNDGGYYLPFAGNCRYMDLMGTYAYGMVMKDLNPDLSKSRQLPEFFTDIVRNGGQGMENGKGIYNYTSEEINHWKTISAEFSYQIEKIINKYPFNYEKEKTQQK